jgi:predicted dehydrogenase
VNQQIGCGVIGCGYWGPNHIRNLTANPGSLALYACDLDAERRGHIAALYPNTRTVPDHRELLDDPEVQAVVIATPVSTHARIAREAIEAGKHVLVEKPIAASVAQAQDLTDLAAARNVTLMVGHTFLYSPAVRMIRKTIAGGDLGNLLYLNMQRLNLGLLQPDINVIWDLAPHDISILLYLLGVSPESVVAHGRANIQPGIEDVATLTLRYASGLIAFLHFSWLDPKKVRRSVFVGDRKMLVYDDIEDTEKIEIYDKGVQSPKHYDTFAEFKIAYRYGEKVTPYIELEEPLKIQTQHFLDCIRTGERPLSDGNNGIEVLRVLEAGQRSLRAGGAPEPLDPGA